MSKKPILANKFLVRAGVNLYGKRYFKKQASLKSNVDLSKLESPYIIVANHCGFADVGGIIKLLSPKAANFVISETQIVKWPKLIKYMGILPKKQFTVDTSLIRDIKYVLSKKRPVVIYPEAKLSVVGELNIVKPAVSKLVKMLKVPLVTVCFHGSYLHKPRWAKSKRFVPIYADVKLAVTQEETASISVEEIHRRITENLTYDDYAYQLENKISVNVPDLCEGLEHILYKCPACSEEFAMKTRGNVIQCAKCESSVTQNEYGVLEGGRFCKVTDWYAWQRECVKEELQNGTYRFENFYRAEKLVGKKYVDLGEAKITHDETGITASWQGNTLSYKTGVFYTLSFNNDYIYLPAKEAVYRFKRLSKVGSNAKLNLAVEEQTKLFEVSKNN